MNTDKQGLDTKLKIAFDNPDSGWVQLNISYGTETFDIIASYTPSDSFFDLTYASHNLLLSDGQYKVTWHCEPEEYVISFSKSGANINLNIDEYSNYRCGDERKTKIFIVLGSYAHICLPFWRALRDLQGRFSTEELEIRWHRPFPSREIDLLTSKIKEIC